MYWLLTIIVNKHKNERLLAQNTKRLLNCCTERHRECKCKCTFASLLLPVQTRIYISLLIALGLRVKCEIRLPLTLLSIDSRALLTMVSQTAFLIHLNFKFWKCFKDFYFVLFWAMRVLEYFFFRVKIIVKSLQFQWLN